MQHVLGSSLSLPAHGLVGVRATLLFFLAAHFAKRNTKFGGGEKLVKSSLVEISGVEPESRQLTPLEIPLWTRRESNSCLRNANAAYCHYTTSPYISNGVKMPHITTIRYPHKL